MNRYIFLLAVLAYIVWVPGTRAVFARFEETHSVQLWTIYACIPILIGCATAFLRENRFTYVVWMFLKSRKPTKLLLQGGLILGWLYLYYGQTIAYNPVTMAIGSALLIVFCVEFANTAPVRLISNRQFVYLGKISYGLYVWQSIILGTGDSSRIIGSKPLAFVCVVLVSICSYELFEKRFLAMKDRWR